MHHFLLFQSVISGDRLRCQKIICNIIVFLSCVVSTFPPSRESRFQLFCFSYPLRIEGKKGREGWKEKGRKEERKRKLMERKRAK